MSNLKDIVTTICGIILAICGTTGVLWTFGIEFPVWVKVVAGILATIAAFLVAYYNGKNADGSAKSKVQIQKQSELK